MPEDDEDPKDWEFAEEIPPDKLKDKWFREEISFKETVPCPVCKKLLPRETMTCLYCGARVFEDSGLLGSLLKWFKKIFRG